MKIKTAPIIIVFSLVFSLFQPVLAKANCAILHDGELVKITIKQCRNISPSTDSRIKQMAGPVSEPWKLEKLYTGALILDSNGTQWVHSTDSLNPCEEFIVGQTIEKRRHQVCCDTGAWGKCIYGGNFLANTNDPKVNTFQ